MRAHHNQVSMCLCGHVENLRRRRLRDEETLGRSWRVHNAFGDALRAELMSREIA
jgi:hypothetical protein